MVRVLFTPVVLGGVLTTGGFVDPSFASTFLLLAMRTCVGVPLMAAVAHRLHGPTWAELKGLLRPDQGRLLGQTLGGVS